jgi:hypothetical protein
VRLLHDLARTHASFDDPDLVSRAGLVPVMALAQRAGLAGLVDEHVRPGGLCGVNAQLKIPCLVAGMAAGADSIDDMDLLRHGAMPDLFGGIRAPSTLGSHLRSFTWGNARQLEMVNRLLLGELARRAPLLAVFCGAVRRVGARFSVTVNMDSRIAAAIAAIPPEAWKPIRYPRAIWDDQLGSWVSDAQVAEVDYNAFTSAKKGQQITARLIVRRVRDLNTQAPAGQGELFPAWRHHAVFTDSPVELVQAEEQHRDHAIVEQVFADWTDGPLAPPAGFFPANAAWLACAAIAHNLLRAAGSLASLAYGKARGATIRRDIVDVAARTARHGRGHITLHLPQAWHREHEWMALFTAACGPPQAAA